MIFVTVGTQLAFPRLIKIINDWNAGRDSNVVAQIGNDQSLYENIVTYKMLPASEVERYYEESQFVIAHAGIGSILTAIQYEKPIIIFPRMERYNEHRNDHQLATCKKFETITGVHVVYSPEDLIKKLNDGKLLSPNKNSSKVSEGIVNFIVGVINETFADNYNN